MTKESETERNESGFGGPPSSLCNSRCRAGTAAKTIVPSLYNWLCCPFVPFFLRSSNDVLRANFKVLHPYKRSTYMKYLSVQILSKLFLVPLLMLSLPLQPVHP